MKNKKFIYIFFAISVLPLALVCLVLYTLFNVEVYEGSVSNITDLPEIGEFLEGLPHNGKIEFRHIKYHGGSTVFFRGMTSEILFQKYFNDDFWDCSEGPSMYDAPFYEKYCYPIVSSEENKAFYSRSIEEIGYNRIMIYYMPPRNEFVGKIIISYRD